MKAYEKIDILLHQSHCSIVPENTALLFPNLLHFIFPKSLYFFFLFTTFYDNVSPSIFHPLPQNPARA